jgi:regulator of sirC expression with transglutaminase-like and TPR domain
MFTGHGNMWKDSQKKSIIQLLDDPSEVVQKELLGYFSEHESEAVELLQKLVEQRRGKVAYFAKQFLDRLGVDNTIETFRNFIESFSYELETGCLLLDRTVNPRLDTTAPSEVLDEMGVRALDLFVEPCSFKEKCRVMNRVMFQEYEFRGDLEEFKNPKSSLISHVVKSRKGIPLSLSIIYILFGIRCGVELRPIGVPGRFMVGCYSEEKPFFIDVFENGRFLSVADVLIFLETNRIEYDEGSLAPIPVGEVLTRNCRNLHNQFLAANDPEKAALFRSFVDAFEDAYRNADRPS